MARLELGVQWHITTNCNHRCQHCYMFDPATWPAERDNTLSLDGLMRILDRIEEFERDWDADLGDFGVTGGDPLLRPDWEEFLGELKRRGKRVMVKGNPETLTEGNIASLVDLGVRYFQMSLDGLESAHDQFRGDPGTFRRTVTKLAALKEAGIACNIMFTLYPTNAHELVPLVRFVATQTEAASFSFDVGVFVGNAVTLSRNFIPAQLRRIFADYAAEKQRLRDAGNPIHLTENSPLYHLTRFENGEFYPCVCRDMSCISGCVIGRSAIAVLSDGTVLGCRRMPSLRVGKLPEQSLAEIFLGSEALKRYRRRGSYVGCGDCDFYQYCRGCPANVHSLTGDPFGRNPFCFRDLVERQTKEAAKLPPDPGLDTTYEEEYRWITSGYDNAIADRLETYLEDAGLRQVFVGLAYDVAEKGRFLADPPGYLAAAGLALDDEKRVFLMTHFAGRADENEIPDEGGDYVAEAMFTKMMQELCE
jgi:radical SAM protein with 4Fe4S-binding SPASM domain